MHYDHDYKRGIHEPRETEEGKTFHVHCIANEYDGASSTTRDPTPSPTPSSDKTPTGSDVGSVKAADIFGSPTIPRVLGFPASSDIRTPSHHSTCNSEIAARPRVEDNCKRRCDRAENGIHRVEERTGEEGRHNPKGKLEKVGRRVLEIFRKSRKDRDEREKNTRSRAIHNSINPEPWHVGQRQDYWQILRSDLAPRPFQRPFSPFISPCHYPHGLGVVAVPCSRPWYDWGPVGFVISRLRMFWYERVL